MSIIETFCHVIGERDKYTVEHSKNVACLMAGFAEYAELPVEDVTLAYVVGIVHDVGKVSVPDHILNKPGRLTEAEFAIIRQHPEVGADILGEVEGLNKVATIVRHHHERYDGKGYGTGLAGDAIPFFSRMLAVCDSFDAMTTVRCYRLEAFSIAKALEEISRCAGSQFDPVISRCFIEFISSRPDYEHLSAAHA
ncbi:HD-GYP domain-containing protein [Sporomusa sp.]|uniref:HD-GYP domain-containing protein n=1 Tax=Sporomusa sp. TaxID=2078658 RepID=UPI002BCAA3C1|nr:HD-GYP domain-containing protein [Sporomusa sp.]MDF2875310.1 Cyclic di-GMP phosphodieSPTERase [Sporomusa sp.]HWR07151.1 HD-GYP domain-containing protein [Sporomusa sp.]